MPNRLVIVESPAKAKTIAKYLGPGTEVLASYGHVRDLVPKEGAVDPEHNYAMRYEVIDRNERHVTAIAKALKKADELILATDPDREGEAISWHLCELLKERNLLKNKPVHRVVFHEITERAVRDAVAHPRELSLDLIDAQQTRRALDYLVGFNLSPLLWKKIKRGLSAGRVQSPALRLICDRENEIEAFVAREYWSFEAACELNGQPFGARLARLRGEKFEQFTITDSDAAGTARRELLTAAGMSVSADLRVDTALPEGRSGELRVSRVEKKERRRNPAAPFTTSTLQQEASRKLGFTASRTMRTAQQLYEGIDLGNGAIGLITYMRTDSTSLAGEAIANLRGLIEDRFGAGTLPNSPRQFKTKSKNAQEAHEAIRPTDATRAPDTVRRFLSADQARLYELIWKRTVACQMIHATFDTVAADLVPVEADDDAIVFRATGQTLKTAGFLAVYRESRDDSIDEDAESALPELVEGDLIRLADVVTEQHFTEPPPRFTEASLVKTLEEYGIGRPSTYASIISTLQNREYVEMDGKRFIPTDTGRIVNAFLTEHFSDYVDYDFTARLEDDLDDIARGEKEWLPVIDGFWRDFHKRVELKEETVSRAEAVQARELGTDPESGRPVSVRLGRFGPIVQIGTKDDEEKPRFAGLLPGQKMDKVTLEEALALFRLPRELGETPEGEPVSVNIGRFGPYVKYGSKYASLTADDDVWTIELPRALEVVAEKKRKDAERFIASFDDGAVQVLNGRWGPYITDGTKNAKIPTETDPKALTREQCLELLAQAPARGRRGAKGKSAATTGSAKGTTKTAANGNAKNGSKTQGQGSKKATTRKAAGSTTTKATTKTTTRKRTSTASSSRSASTKATPAKATGGKASKSAKATSGTT